MNIKHLMYGALLVALTACGSPDSKPPPTNETLFTEANAWKEPLPAGAQQVSPEEFRQKIASGQAVLVSTASLAAQKAANEQKYQDDLASLKALPNPSQAVQDVLAQVAANPQDRADRPVTLPSGETVILLGLEAQVQQLADTLRLSGQSANALAAYRLSYDLLPETLRAQAATPASLNGQSVDAILQAGHQLDGLLGQHPERLGAAHREASQRMSAQGMEGNGKDNNGPCDPSGLAGQYWFPLKNFVSPMKNQAKRGTCWAFTAIGAVESRERVQNNNSVNLSEQFLVQQVRLIWAPNDGVESGAAESAMQLALQHNTRLLPETGATYNPSRQRGKDFQGSCYGYDGYCSNTAHQAYPLCADSNGKSYCGYIFIPGRPNDPPASPPIPVWQNGQAFDLNRYRALLANGHVLIANFPVYKGFMDDVTRNGLVTNYKKTMLDKDRKEVSGSYGGHVVQIVGFLSNDDLQVGGTPASIGGGGYFIIKNSWGCNPADSGYYYVPADYVSSLFSSLSTLDFDARRSDAWNTEQANPGGSNAPQIAINTSPRDVDLRVQANLTSAFTISHVARSSVGLKVTSDKDGVIYDGNWSTDPSLLVKSQLLYTFQTGGTRTLTLTATFGTTQTVKTFTVNVVNTPPSIVLKDSGQAYQGEDYLMTAVVSDINEPNLSALCSDTHWSVTTPDTVMLPTDCQVTLRFGSTGPHEIRAITRDSEGLTASASLTVNVAPPPVNPYPKIKSATVDRTQYGTFNMCRLPSGPEANGATLDLNADPGTGCDGQPNVSPYTVHVDVENPSNEALTYTWTFWDSVPGDDILISNTPQVPYYRLSSGSCGVSVTVTPPDASRARTQPVWSGMCKAYIKPPH